MTKASHRAGTSTLEPTRISVDDARLRPHLRDHTRSEYQPHERKRMIEAQADALLEAVIASTDGVKPTVAGGDPRDLRGIPVIARGVGGTSPHTQPEQETVSRSERRRAA